MAQVWLWCKECPDGKIHEKKNEARLIAEGWVDDPIKLEPKLVKLWHVDHPEGVEYKAEQVDRLLTHGWTREPMSIITATGTKEVRVLVAGFDQAPPVFTAPDQTSLLDQDDADTGEELAEDLPPLAADLLATYKQSEALLNDAEVLALAKQMGLDVRTTMKRATLVAKIDEAIG